MSSTIQCFASRQSINEGVAVRLIPLVLAHKYQPETCRMPGRIESQVVYGLSSQLGRPEDSWAPQEGFIEATATDYGDFILKHTDANAALLTSFFAELWRHGAVVELSDQQINFRDTVEETAPDFAAAVKTDYSSLVLPSPAWPVIEALWKAVLAAHADEQLFFSDFCHAIRPMSFGVLLEPAYQHLLKLGEETPRGDTSCIREEYLEALRLKGIQKASTASISDDPEEHDPKRVTRIVCGTVVHGLNRLDNEALNSFRQTGALEAAIYRHVSSPDSCIDSAILAPFKSFLDDRYVLRGLELCRVPLEPVRFSGQDYVNDAGRRFATLVKSVSGAVNASNIERFGTRG